jgi:hypothetical protein
VVRRQSDTHWQKLVETELNHRFAPSADSLTRCVLVLGPVRSELIFAHHHVTADALSLVFAVRDLLTDMAQLAQGQATSTVESLPLRPPLSRLLPASARGLSRFRHMTAFFNKHILLRPLRRTRKLPLENAVPPRERSNRILHRSLNPEQTHRLAELAKQKALPFMQRCARHCCCRSQRRHTRKKSRRKSVRLSAASPRSACGSSWNPASVRRWACTSRRSRPFTKWCRCRRCGS